MAPPRRHRSHVVKEIAPVERQQDREQEQNKTDEVLGTLKAITGGRRRKATKGPPFNVRNQFFRPYLGLSSESRDNRRENASRNVSRSFLTKVRRLRRGERLICSSCRYRDGNRRVCCLHLFATSSMARPPILPPWPPSDDGYELGRRAKKRHIERNLCT